MDIEPGIELIITMKDVQNIEDKLLEKIIFEDFPEDAARTLAYVMGVHDFAKALAEEITNGEGWIA